MTRKEGHPAIIPLRLSLSLPPPPVFKKGACGGGGGRGGEAESFILPGRLFSCANSLEENPRLAQSTYSAKNCQFLIYFKIPLGELQSGKMQIKETRSFKKKKKRATVKISLKRRFRVQYLADSEVSPTERNGVYSPVVCI